MSTPARALGVVGRARLQPSRMNVTVTNRQRLLKIDAALLKKITSHVLTKLCCAAVSRPRTLIDRRSPKSARSGDLRRTAGLFDSLSIVLVDDEAIAELNSQYHHVEGPTDILSFDYGDGNGELIISVEHAKSQAKRFRSTPSRELALYVVHGILHLDGHDDSTPRQRTRMRSAERRLLASVEKAYVLGKLVK
jgi:rRNA maturation RNase YbeY